MPRNFETRPLSSALGAEIIGLDVSRPIDPDTVAELVELWTDNILLLFRKPDMTPEEQLNFARCFGRVGERPKPKDKWEDDSKLDSAFMLVSNIRENGKPIGTLPDGEMLFHHDTIFKKQPHIGTLLYAIEVPAHGGNTKFSNLYAAYDALPDDLKERVKGRTATHIYDYVTIANANRKSQAGDLRENSTHPVCITHPRSGREALYVDRLMTARINGLPEEEGENILETMFDISERPEHVYEHVWTPGDLLLWDNLCSAHARTDFPSTERRLLRRCQIESDDIPRPSRTIGSVKA